MSTLPSSSSSPLSSIRNKQSQRLSCCFVILASLSLSQMSIILNVKCLLFEKFHPVGLDPPDSVCLWSTPALWWWPCPSSIQYFPSSAWSTSTPGYSSLSRPGKDYSNSWQTARWEFQHLKNKLDRERETKDFLQGERFERGESSGLVGVRLHCLPHLQVLRLHHWAHHTSLLRYER